MKQNYPWAAFDDPVMMKIGLKKISNRINLDSVSSFKFLQQMKIERQNASIATGIYGCGEISLNKSQIFPNKCSPSQLTYRFPPFYVKLNSILRLRRFSTHIVGINMGTHGGRRREFPSNYQTTY